MNDCFFMFHSHPSSFSLIFFNALRYLERMVLGFFSKIPAISLHRYIHQKQTTPRSAFPHLLIPKILLLRQPASQKSVSFDVSSLRLLKISSISSSLRNHVRIRLLQRFTRICIIHAAYFFFFPQLPPFFIGDQCRILYRIFCLFSIFSDNNMLFYTSGDKSLHNNG